MGYLVPIKFAADLDNANYPGITCLKIHLHECRRYPRARLKLWPKYWFGWEKPTGDRVFAGKIFLLLLIFTPRGFTSCIEIPVRNITRHYFGVRQVRFAAGALASKPLQLV